MVSELLTCLVRKGIMEVDEIGLTDGNRRTRGQTFMRSYSGQNSKDLCKDGGMMLLVLEAVRRLRILLLAYEQENVCDIHLNID